MTKKALICFPHKPSSEGGPGTFQNNLESYLKQNDFDIIYPESKLKPDLIFVVAGTRRILWLLLMKFRGVKILHRLDGMNWKYKYEHINFKNRYKQVLQNLIIVFIRNFLADLVVYQSKFIEKWWTGKYGEKKNSSIIVNGSSFFESSRIVNQSKEKITLTCIEGNIQDDNVTTSILQKLDTDFPNMENIDSIEIFGNHSQIRNLNSYTNLQFRGSVPRRDVKGILQRKKRIFFLLELNPPCPNSMIECLSLGFPCVGFDSGAYEELLDGAGISIPYNGDVWKLEEPSIDDILDAVNKVSRNYENYSSTALEVAEKYDIKNMTREYLEAIDSLLI